MLKSLSHPNLVKYMGVDRDDTYFYIFMEYAEAIPSLNMLKADHPPLQKCRQANH